MPSNKKIGLFFGSFNPVHIGHMIIANYIAIHGHLDEVWMVVTPHNPHKEKKSLAPNRQRLEMVHLAIGKNQRLRASDIEFQLPQPSYTIDTLTFLSEKHPSFEFNLIMGGDNLKTLHKWKNADVLTRDYNILVYQRPNYELNEVKVKGNITILDAPMIEISSTYIRNSLKNNKSVQYLVPEGVFEYLDQTNLYR